MTNKISNANLSFTCNQDWNKMKPALDGRFCNACQKKVYDFTDKNVAYFVKIMEENNNKVCGRFIADQLTSSSQTNKPYWKKWLIAVMFFIGISAVTEKAKSQSVKLGKAVAKKIDPALDKGHITRMGEIKIVPAPLELKSLHTYVVKNCKVPTSVNGKLTVSFTIGKDGSLSNLRTSNQLGENITTEVIRVLKSAPKWKNADKYYGNLYSLYLIFKNGEMAPEYQYL